MINEIKFFGKHYDRREKTYPKIFANQRDFVQAGKYKRTGVYLGAINTLRDGSMGEVGSDTYVSQRELNQCLGIGERKKLIWDMNASQRAKFMTNDPTFTIFENPNDRREVRRHTDKNIDLCKLWYLSFKPFSNLQSHFRRKFVMQRKCFFDHFLQQTLKKRTMRSCTC